jgi:hypothetical protein
VNSEGKDAIGLDEASNAATARRRLLAITTDVFEEVAALEELGAGDSGEVELRIVVPAVEATPFRHTLGDIDEPRREAEERLAAILASLRRQGIEAVGEVGDPDPVQAAQDALLKAPADEVLIFERQSTQARWFEEGLFERAKAAIEPPLRMIVLDEEPGGDQRAVVEESTGRGTVNPDEGKEVGSAYLPGLSRGDFAGMVIGVVGTIVAAVLAAAAAANGGSISGWRAVAVLIAIGIALVNVAHVVGLTLMESVRYRGGFAKFFRTMALVGTPIAVLVNLLILLLT